MLEFVDLRNTRLCRFWPHCRRGKECNFAHGVQELQPKKCRYWDECWKRECPYVHPPEREKKFKLNPIWKKKEEPVQIQEHVETEIREVLRRNGMEYVTVHINVFELQD